MIEQKPIGKNVLKELLDSGYTWLKKDDLGYGSIQEKFGANDAQIALLRKHPLAKGLETTAVIFTIVDDTNNESITDTRTAKRAEPVQPVSRPEVHTQDRANVSAEKPATTIVTAPTVDDELEAFANL